MTKTDTNTLAPSDAEILALNAGEVHFSESPSKYPAAGFGTQYHAGAPGVLSFARAVLAKWGAPAPASQPVALASDSGPSLANDPRLCCRSHPHEKQSLHCQLREVAAWLRWHSAAGKTPSADSVRAHAEQVDAVALELRSAPAGVEPVARIRYERNTPGRENEMPRVLSCNRMADGVYEVFTASQVQAALAAAPSGPVRVPLTAAQMAAGREAIFSTANPYCPCDSKTFRKVAEWVERHHGITAAPKGGQHAE